jgi:hypothetical protein
MECFGRAYVWLFLFFLVAQEAKSQDKVSFGKVSLDELKMSRYDKDTTAEAVILSDVGRLDGNNIHFTRHIRIKVLKKSGLRWGNWVFNTPSKSDFKVAVFNLSGGQIVKEKAEPVSVFKEDVVRDYAVYKVFAPSVRVGSVIDIYFWFVGVPREWRFQETIPVVYSELTLEPTDRIYFTKTSSGLEPLEAISPFKWRARYVPAFKVEPFTNNYSNYITKFSIQLESISLPGYQYLAYSTSWRKIIDNLLSSKYFGSHLEGSNFLNDQAKAIKEKNLPVNKAIEEVYAYVQKNAKWNGVKTLFASLDLRKNFEENHSCSSAEINLVLIALLNKIGINTVPLVLSTRDNGLIPEHTAMVDKLNYVVGFVDHENTRLLLDATSEFAAPGILPGYCLNGRGLMVKRDNEQWLTLAGNNKAAKSQYTEVNVGKNGEATATINRDFSGYAFLDWMEGLKKSNYNADAIKNELQKGNPKIKIDKYEVVNKNREAMRGKETLTADVSDQLIDAGDEYLLNPFVFFEYAENPFKSETRKNPVDLGCPKELKSTIVVRIPNDFEIKQIPASTKFATPDGSASFTFFASGSPGKLEFMALVKISKYIFTETEYLELRQFFSEMIKVINMPVTLSKKT